MEIYHHGAVNGVTGSCHELRLDSSNGILIDCGLFQGAEISGDSADHGISRELAVNFPVEHIQALVVTHVHIDHVGRIPPLLAAGFAGPIYCTEASAVLLPLVLEDAVKVSFTKNKALIKRVIGRLKELVVPVPYGAWQSVSLSDKAASTLVIRFSPAGHILGSAYVMCRVKDTVSRYKEDVLFSGDLGAPWSPLLPAPKSPWGCDRLVIESTYGDSEHEDRRARRNRLQAILEQSMADAGVVLIPAFSIGRTQELLYEIEGIIHGNKQKTVQGGYQWQDIEVIVDSPLAAKFTEVYRQLKPLWDTEAQKLLRSGRHPLSFGNLLTINNHAEHLQTVEYLKRRTRPCIVIAASGMCSGARIVNYLKALLAEKSTDEVFVGYQARGTLGRDILRWGPRGGYVIIDGERIKIRAGVHRLDGYSAHADKSDLVNFVQRMRKWPREIRIVHGDEAAKESLQAELRQVVPGAEVLIPRS